MRYKDDCEEVFYLMLFLVGKKGLPWRKLTGKIEVLM